MHDKATVPVCIHVCGDVSPDALMSLMSSLYQSVRRVLLRRPGTSNCPREERPRPRSGLHPAPHPAGRALRDSSAPGAPVPLLHAHLLTAYAWGPCQSLRGASLLMPATLLAASLKDTLRGRLIPQAQAAVPPLQQSPLWLALVCTQRTALPPVSRRARPPPLALPCSGCSALHRPRARTLPTETEIFQVTAWLLNTHRAGAWTFLVRCYAWTLLANPWCPTAKLRLHVKPRGV